MPGALDVELWVVGLVFGKSMAPEVFEADVVCQSFCGCVDAWLWEGSFKAKFETMPEEGVGAMRWCFHSAEIVVCCL